MKQVIFTLTSARSGTLYLRDLFGRNVRDCDCRHEPFFDWGNPTLLGPVIYEASVGRLDTLRSLLAKKRDYINRLPGKAYLESSHAFLKSAYLAALEFFPRMQLIHLIRDPLKVAKSEAFRETWRRRLHAPLHYYRAADGRRHFFWSLTGNEEIYHTFDLERLSPFQRYLIQWVEIENRAMNFLKTYGLEQRCFTIHVPKHLNDADCVKTMFDFFGLAMVRPNVVLGRPRNKSLGPTLRITAADEAESEEVLAQMLGRYLEIFAREPYSGLSWSRRLHPGRPKAPGQSRQPECLVSPVEGCTPWANSDR